MPFLAIQYTSLFSPPATNTKFHKKIDPQKTNHFKTKLFTQKEREREREREKEIETSEHTTTHQNNLNRLINEK